MHSKNLKFPFTWENRTPLIQDRVFYVPKHYSRHEEWRFPAWEDARVFGRRATICIEYCSGNGSWIVEKAKRQPDWNWIAVEKRFFRVKKIYAKMKNEGIDNLFIVCGEAHTFTKHYVPSDSFQDVFINFPDPWPKARHAKHRLFHDDFILELARTAKEGARTTCVTDYVDYAEHILKAMLKAPQWTAAFPAPHFLTEWEDYGTSFFEELWRTCGRTIHYLQFSKQ